MAHQGAAAPRLGTTALDAQVVILVANRRRLTVPNDFSFTGAQNRSHGQRRYCNTRIIAVALGFISDMRIGLNPD